MNYDLEQRTLIFSEYLIEFCSVVPQGSINTPIINQLIRSGTSIGANYSEANSASSKKDFKNKIYICKKEAQETEYWLKLVLKANPSLIDSINKLRNENSQFILIFGKILSTINNRIESKLSS